MDFAWPNLLKFTCAHHKANNTDGRDQPSLSLTPKKASYNK